MADAVRAGRAAYVLRSRLQEAQRERARAQLARWLPTLGPWLQAARHKRKRPAGSPPRSARPRSMRREQSAGAGAVERRVLVTTATAGPTGPAAQAGQAGELGRGMLTTVASGSVAGPGQVEQAAQAAQAAQAGPSQASRRSSSSESSRDTSPLSVSGAPELGPGPVAQGLFSAHALLALGAEERGAALAAITGGAPTPTLTPTPTNHNQP